MGRSHAVRQSEFIPHLSRPSGPAPTADASGPERSSRHALPGISQDRRQARVRSGLPVVLCAALGDKMAARGRRAEPPGREAPGPAAAGGGGSRWAESGPGTSPESGDEEMSSPVSCGVNLFANDGSFLELFKRKMEEEQRQRQEEPPPGPPRPDQPATAAAAGPGDPKRKGGPGPTLSFVRSRGGGGGRQGLPWQGESGPRKGIGIQVQSPTSLRGSSKSPTEDAEPGFPTSEVWGWTWGPSEPAGENREPGIGKPGYQNSCLSGTRTLDTGITSHCSKGDKFKFGVYAV